MKNRSRKTKEEQAAAAGDSKGGDKGGDKGGGKGGERGGAKGGKVAGSTPPPWELDPQNIDPLGS